MYKIVSTQVNPVSYSRQSDTVVSRATKRDEAGGREGRARCAEMCRSNGGHHVNVRQKTIAFPCSLESGVLSSPVDDDETWVDSLVVVPGQITVAG